MLLYYDAFGMSALFTETGSTVWPCIISAWFSFYDLKQDPFPIGWLMGAGGLGV